MEITHKENTKIDSDNWVNEHGDMLYRHALIRLGNNSQLAEDMVQETFLSAFKTDAKYQGKSSECTWLFSILKNKIIDHYRRNKNKLFEQVDFRNEEFIEQGARAGSWMMSLY